MTLAWALWQAGSDGGRNEERTVSRKEAGVEKKINGEESLGTDLLDAFARLAR